MTAKEFLRTLPKNTTWDLQTIVQEAMREFAKLKCEELLKIVAEKAVTKTEKKSQYGKHRKWQKVKEGEEFDLFQYEMKFSIDKDSILNAVKLDEFIR